MRHGNANQIVPLSLGRNPYPEIDLSLCHARIQRIYGYWLSIHPSGRLPGRQHLDPLDIPDLLPSVWLLDVQREPLRLRYRLVGTKIVDVLRREVTGQWLDEVNNCARCEADDLNRFHATAVHGRPGWRKGCPVFWCGECSFDTVENILLPLATDGQSVDILIAYSIFYGSDGRIF